MFKKLISNGLRNTLSRIPSEIKTMIIHAKSLLKISKYDGDLLKLNIGSGDVLKKGWVNIDLINKKCLQLDLREKLPFKSSSVSEIYSEHFLEHLSENYALKLIKESYRVLIPGGLFSVGVPDGEVLLESYVNGLKIDDYKILDLNKHLPINPTKMQIINLMFRSFGHQYTYDYETMEKILISAGFQKINKREFDTLRDSNHRKDWTLYVDAFK